MIYRISKELSFPDPILADEDGLLAFGGDLSTERLLLAYSLGIFPWYSEENPILWFSPHKRFVLFPGKLKITKSMQQVIRNSGYKITFNHAFAEVIKACAESLRKGQPGTWITDEMQEAYILLHKKGFAHSVEVWLKGELVGGLYGVETGNVFSGESMFSRKNNASKLALVWLCQHTPYSLIDCQVYSEHLEKMGAEIISREEYLAILNERIKE